MLRRLAHRFNGGDGDVEPGSRPGRTDKAITIPGRQAISRKTAETFGLLDADCDEEEDNIERWIMQAGQTNALAGGLASDLASGRRVWVPDGEEVWRIAKVVSESADGGSYAVSAKGGTGEVQVPREVCADYDPSHNLNLADISRMNLMHEAPLLHLLHRRFQANVIYTNVADVLVSINPYADIAGLYDIPIPGGEPAEAFGVATAAREVGATSQLSALERMLGKPHVYGIAERAFRYMADSKGREIDGRIRRRNQSILITGESGAGKTEASKHVMRFLITASKALAGTMSAPSPTSSRPACTIDDKVAAATAKAKHTEDVLLRSNTVLEAFGNAKTARNDNSSRFGKYIKLLYNQTFRLVGARTEHFLLEKSRLVHLEEGERTYHILYQVAKALPANQKEALFLSVPAASFSLLNQGNCLEASADVDDNEEFHAVGEALSSLNFSRGEKTDMWRLLATILHSGNVRFEESPGQERDCVLKVGDAKNFSPAALASLWGVDLDVFEAGVMRRTVTAGGTSVSVVLNAAQARDNLLALLKHMYRQLFAWINWKINVVFDLPVEAEAFSKEDAGAETEKPAFIGILDIFGFEIIETNGFEQLCINFANEVLQQEFNRHIFVLEQEEYKAEGLKVESIPFRDNQPIIDLIAKRPAGLMPILEDQALTGRKAASPETSLTDRDLLDLFHQQHHRNAPHPRYRKPRFDGPEFVIMHYAADVAYCVTGFLEKNNDTLQKDLRDMLVSSCVPFLRQLVLGQNGGLERARCSADGNRNGNENGNCCDECVTVAAAGRWCQNGNGDVGNSAVAMEGRSFSSYTSSRSGSPLSSRERGPCLAATDRNDTTHTGGLLSSHFHSDCNDGSGNGVGGREGAGSGGGGDRGGGARVPSPDSPPLGHKGEGQTGGSMVSAGGANAGARGRRRASKKGSSTRMAAKTTVSNAFRSQLDELVAQLRETEPHYIKCIKPSCDKARGGWVSSLVIEQLRYSGVLEVVRIRQEAFPMRVRYTEFYRRFSKLLASKGGIPPVDVGTAAEVRLAGLKICETVFGVNGVGSSFQTGKTKIFLRSDGLERLRAALRMHYFDLTVQIQALWRGAGTRAQVACRREAVGKIQKLARGDIERRRYRKVRGAAVLSQSVSRMQTSTTGNLAQKQASAAVTMQEASDAGTVKENEKARLVTRKRHPMDPACSKRIASVTRIPEDQQKEEEPSPGRQAKRTLRGCLRNKRLRRRAVQAFQAARSGDAPALARHLREFPMLLFLRDRHDASIPSNVNNDSQMGFPSFSTLVHAACQSGAVEAVALLQPFLSDVTAVDRWGNTPMHVAAAGCHYELLKFLARRANLDIGELSIRDDRAPANGALAPDSQPSPTTLELESGLTFAGGSTEKEAVADVTRMARRLRIRVAEDAGQTDEHRLLRALVSSGCERGNTTTLQPRAGYSNGDGLVIEGFLQKRRETGRCRQRWCQVKPVSSAVGCGGGAGPGLFYFKHKYAKVPSKIILLKHCFLKESDAVSFAFELYSPLLTERKNGEGRLYFQTGEESELQRWLLALRPTVKSYELKSCNPRLPMGYLNQERREHLVRLENHLRQTPLHLVVALVDRKRRRRHARAGVSRAGDDKGMSEVNYAVQRVATWLIENGADPKAWADYGGCPSPRKMKSAGIANEAVELHQRNGDREQSGTTCWNSPMYSLGGKGKLALRRLRKRANTTSSQKDAVTAADAAAFSAEGIAPGGFGNALVVSPGGSVVLPLLPAPTKRGGFSYVSVFAESLKVTSTAGIVKPFLILSVRCEKEHLVEAAQVVEAPARIMSDILWWGRTWHMQTPLEALSAGSTVVFELWHVPKGDTKTMFCWGALPLNEDNLGTQSGMLPTYLPPISLGKVGTTNRSNALTYVNTTTITTPQSPPSPNATTGVENVDCGDGVGAACIGGISSPLVRGATLAVEVHLTRVLG